jgi:hypothetical protein
MQTRSIKRTTLGSVSLGARFVFRTAQIFGDEYANSRKLPFEGKLLTVVGFKPHYVNQIVLQDPYGHEFLFRLSDVETALRFSPTSKNAQDEQQ